MFKEKAQSNMRISCQFFWQNYIFK